MIISYYNSAEVLGYGGLGVGGVVFGFWGVWAFFLGFWTTNRGKTELRLALLLLSEFCVVS